MNKKDFEEKYKHVIPEGKFKRITAGSDVMSADTNGLHHDTPCEVSVMLHNGTATKFAQARHPHYAEYVEDVLNALREGSLVWKEELPAIDAPEEHY
ncbi:MAG: hypothetical protein IBX57_00510 [Gammaproteobacteria bacterium]|nr:hypothetical protein [Gammaproteobacteria bacterium]